MIDQNRILFEETTHLPFNRKKFYCITLSPTEEIWNFFCVQSTAKYVVRTVNSTVALILNK